MIHRCHCRRDASEVAWRLVVGCFHARLEVEAKPLKRDLDALTRVEIAKKGSPAGPSDG